jgi:hypothetical protein
VWIEIALENVGSQSPFIVDGGPIISRGAGPDTLVARVVPDVRLVSMGSFISLFPIRHIIHNKVRQ